MRKRLHLIMFLAIASLTATAHTVVEWDDYYEVEHTCEYNKKNCTISLNISKELYRYFRYDREHLAYRYRFQGDELPPNYFSFMLSEHDRPVMQALATEFSRNATSDLEKINLALSFVQSLSYAHDTDSKGADEYVRYPIETLVDGCGDCEDKVALLTALFYELDVDFILLVLPEHMAIGVHCDNIEADRYLQFRGKRYYYLETTMTGWLIGQIPEDYAEARMEAVPVDDTPSLLMKGVRFESKPASVFHKADCELEVDLQNIGPGRATGLMLRVRIIEKGRPNYLLADEYYSLNTLHEGEQRTELISLKSLIKENCVLELELTGAEVAPLSYTLGLGYQRTRN